MTNKNSIQYNDCERSELNETINTNQLQVVTFEAARKVGSKLIFSDFSLDNQITWIIRGNTRIKEGYIQLQIEDDILVLEKVKKDYLFYHYKVISLTEKDNCELVTTSVIKIQEDIDKLPKRIYRKFINSLIHEIIN